MGGPVHMLAGLATAVAAAGSGTLDCPGRKRVSSCWQRVAALCWWRVTAKG
jgi:hypothetical protein